MALSGLSVATGATVSTSGGTAVAVTEKTRGLTSVVLAATDDTLAAQRTFTFSVSEPKVTSSNPTGYTQARRTLVIKFPVDLGGDLGYNVDKVTIEVSTGISTPAATMIDYRRMAAQALIDSDLLGFWNNQLLG